MKKIFLVLMVTFSASHVYAQKPVDKFENSNAGNTDDPCAVVTCANHGICVIVKGGPVCACNEGYEADPTTGLSCRPTRSIKRLVPVQERQQLPEQARVERALGTSRGRLDGKYQDYLKSNEDTFASYMYGSFTKKLVAGIPILLVGIGTFGAAVGLSVAAGSYDADLDNTNNAYLYAGLACYFAAAPLVIVGSVLTGKGRAGRRKMKKLLSIEERAAGKRTIRFAGLSPLFTANASPNGAALNFQF